MLRGHQYVEQGDDVLHLAAIDQGGFFTDLRRDVQGLQGVPQGQQTGAFARQGHDLAGLQAGLVVRAGNLSGDPRGGLPCFERAPGFLRQLTRGGQAVAPTFVWRGCIVTVLISRCAPRYWRQAAQAAGLGGGGGVQAKAFVAVGFGGRSHHGVDGVYHPYRVAAGVVAGQQVAAQGVDHKGLRGDEDLWLGPAEAVNALLRVTHQEHAGGRPCAPVPAEPGRQRLPLQRIGVLKLVNHQVFDAGVQPLLHPAGQHRVAQHALGGALYVVHVHPLAGMFERAELS